MEVIVAKVGTAHGLKGDVVVDIRTDDPTGRLARGAELHTDRGQTLTVVAAKPLKHRMLVRFEEISDRTAAESLRGALLMADIDEEAEAAEDPEGFYPSQIRGFKVSAVDGTDLGEVSDLIVGGPQDLLEVTCQGEKVLVPFIMELVPEIDVDAQTVTVDPPGGMFPGYGEEA